MGTAFEHLELAKLVTIQFSPYAFYSISTDSRCVRLQGHYDPVLLQKIISLYQESERAIDSNGYIEVKAHISGIVVYFVLTE